MYIRDPERPDEKLEKVKRDIGNVTNQTEVTFEFGVRSKTGSYAFLRAVRDEFSPRLELKEKYQLDLDQLKQLPFQVQVTYTAADGSKALRVLTQLKEATENRTVAEINAYRGVIAQNHIQSTANDMMFVEIFLRSDNLTVLCTSGCSTTTKMTTKPIDVHTDRRRERNGHHRPFKINAWPT